MSGDNATDPTINISISMTVSYVEKLDKLVSNSACDKRSEYIRVLIDGAYSNMIKNSREELVKSKKLLEEKIKALESLRVIDESELLTLRESYKKFKRNNSLDLDSYKTNRLKFIENNMDIFSITYPEKTYDEIYQELERTSE